MSSNVSGTSNIQDLSTLVSNLQNTVNNISSSFTNLQSSISNINSYDAQNNLKLAQIDTYDANQESEISALKLVDINENNRLAIIESKFPITNFSILDETINEGKIKNLTSKSNEKIMPKTKKRLKKSLNL